MNDDHEELEHIPWSELMADTRPDPRRFVSLGAGVLAVLAIGVIAGRALSSPDTPDPVVVADAGEPAPTQTTVAEATTVVPVPVETTASAVTTTTPEPAGLPTTTAPPDPSPPLYTEADLRAVPEEAFVRAAVARAEWFVTDYFTADSEENGVSDILGALLPGTELPTMPQEVASAITYVEWARAFRVEAEGDGVYTVGVLFRSLATAESDVYYRTRMRAVEVTVAVGVDGGTTVLDLPAAVPIPVGPLVSLPRSEPIVPPPEVAAEAVLAASGWGDDPSVLGATLEPEGWRVVVTTGDEIGTRWPLIVRVPVE